MWLQVQTKLNFVTLRNTGIEDIIPDGWFEGIGSEVTYLILTNNIIKGRLPHKLAFPTLNTIDLSSNNFEGPFPLWSTNATELRLYENNFSGSLPLNIDVLVPRMQKIYLFHNNFTGNIPSSLCEVSGLQILSLRKNHFSDAIPESLGMLPSLSVLLLNQNAFEGEIQESLQNCSSLTNIDFGGNKLTGKLPSWVGKLSSLFMLPLQSNSFTGAIPDDLCSIPNLRIMDLSRNKISGLIPKCISNLTALARGTRNEVFQNLVFIVTRAREYEDIVNSINFSGNNISGEIPREVLGHSYLES
ncbi:LRR receptor-like serine/threonine-protein kinase ERECTA [Arabidopsis lyrata subsp. lyrata]|uniref:LRR receptor-like serine/threonine-protein kinase ERECTA n=1 Tax=Arabidopsis lyrata subsp. lyrata TaxID=81972 RepID=UPI000A29B498|nr:LRR receptor-like serine/threonine-protein kinase ERECTA [Arabidopsis lyrata subsp. lyrata]|eukprot:XP_020883413.1 LRR receptor-like serine/threonine-protein kinase ERECTA [Arabidopsis lyrata subsp. lyrata]